MPELQRLPLGQTVLPWRADPDGMSFYVYDAVTQRLSGRHYYVDDGRIEPSPIEMRYVWPPSSTSWPGWRGMRLEHRWGGWGREPFTAPQPVARVGLREALSRASAPMISMTWPSGSVT